jgi:hypothetical protein
MSELPAALKARVPTLTEVLDAPEMPDLGDVPLWPSPPGDPPPFLRTPVGTADSMPDTPGGKGAQALVESVMASLAPQIEALVSSRLRDVLAPAVQEAVDEAVERCRQPLIDALQVQLREQLELVLARPAKPGAVSVDAPPNTAGLRFS